MLLQSSWNIPSPDESAELLLGVLIDYDGSGLEARFGKILKFRFSRNVHVQLRFKLFLG